MEIFNSILLGIGLAMDAFSVSLADGLREPDMRRSRMAAVAATFAGYQFLMPILGWICIHSITSYFTSLTEYVPWVALLLLSYIGMKMLIDGVREKRFEIKEQSAGISESEISMDEARIIIERADGKCLSSKLTFGALMIQGIATSIDALSVGFTISEYSLSEAVKACLVIAVTTFVICVSGLRIGKRFGTVMSGEASILGGIILIAIGMEIFIKGIFL